MNLVRKGHKIGHAPEHIGHLHHDAGGLAVALRFEGFLRVRRESHGLVPGITRKRLDHRPVMRMDAAGQHGLAPLRDPVRHQHGLGRRGRAVIHGGVRDLHAGQQRNLALKLEQIVQRALRDLRLIGRVRGHELRPLDDIIDGGGNMMLVGAAARKKGHRTRRHVARRHCGERAFDGHFALLARQGRQRVEQLRGRNIGEKRGDVRHADGIEHLAPLTIRMGKVAHQPSELAKAR